MGILVDTSGVLQLGNLSWIMIVMFVHVRPTETLAYPLLVMTTSVNQANINVGASDGPQATYSMLMIHYGMGRTAFAAFAVHLIILHTLLKSWQCHLQIILKSGFVLMSLPHMKI